MYNIPLPAPYPLPTWSFYIYREQIGRKQGAGRKKTGKRNKMKPVHASKKGKRNGGYLLGKSQRP